MAQWREHLPPTNVAWVKFPDVICGLNLLVLYSAPRGFSLGNQVFPSPQNPLISTYSVSN